MPSWWECFRCANVKNPDDYYSLDFSHHSLTDVPPIIFQYERTLEKIKLNSNRVSYNIY